VRRAEEPEMWTRWKINMEERRQEDNGTKEIKERKKEGEELRYKINNSLLNFKGLYTVVI
jgi:hypothetical protein